MNLDPRLFASVLVASLAACGPVVSGGGGAPPPPPPSARCDGTRWIGTIPACVSLPNWSASPLFAGLPAPLDQYCVYEWTGGGVPSSVDLNLLQVSGPLNLGEDCPVVVPQALPYDEVLARSLRDRLHDQVGTVDNVGLSRPAAGQPVQVVVVDSAPDALFGGAIPVGNDRHGDTMANIVHDITCGPLGCAAQTSTALALPWIDESNTPPAGGHAGRLSDLALAVLRAYDASTAKGKPRRLILNLSVGWEDQTNIADCDDHPELSSAPARAVHDVLQYVTCNGALVIAAAGNDAGGPLPPSGLICPARWESLPISGCVGGHAEPLLTAVGAVDYADRPIAVTRPHGRPRLMATGLGGEGWRHGTPTPPPLTGSSVSAAVMSAVAAVVWSRDSSLSAADVARQVYAHGVTITPPEAADSCPFGVPIPCSLHRVSLCSALLGLGVAGVACTPASALPTGTPPLPLGALPGPTFSAAAPFSVTAVDVTAFTALPRYASPSPALSGGLFPQPVYPICPSCIVQIVSPGSSIFYARPDVTVTSPTLVFTGATTRSALLALSGSLTLGTSRRFDVDSLPSGTTSIYLTGFDTGGASVTQEIPIYH